MFVDGYYAGVVDDFDGLLQRLNIEAGPYRIEVRASRFGEATKLEGEMTRLP